MFFYYVMLNSFFYIYKKIVYKGIRKSNDVWFICELVVLLLSVIVIFLLVFFSWFEEFFFILIFYDLILLGLWFGFGCLVNLYILRWKKKYNENISVLLMYWCMELYRRIG